MSDALATIEMIEPATDVEPKVAALANVQELVLDRFRALEALVPDLEKKYGKTVYAVDTPKGMKAAKEARAEAREARLKVKPLAAEIKGILKDAGLAVTAKCDLLIAKFEAIEDFPDQQIKAQERIKEEEAAKAKQLKEEQHRRAQEIIDTIHNRKELAQGQTPATILDIRKGLEAIDLSEHDFGTRATEAARAKAEMLVELARMHVQAIEWEETKRVSSIKADIERFERMALNAIGAPSANVATAIASIEAVEITAERFQEFVPQANATRARVLMQLRTIHEAALTNEAAAAAVATAAPAHAEVAAPAPALSGHVSAPASLVGTIANERAHQIAASLRIIEQAPGRYNAEMDAAVLADAIAQLRALPMSVSIYGGKIAAARAAVEAAVAELQPMHAQAVAREAAAQAKHAARMPSGATHADPDPLAVAMAALRGLLRLVDDSQGVVGYLEHRGVKLWEDIPAVAAAERAVALVDAQTAALDESAPF